MKIQTQHWTEFQSELSENFIRVENTFGTMYDLLKIEMMVGILDEKIVQMVDQANSELKNEDFEAASSMSRQPDVFFIRNEFHDTFRKSIFISSFSYFECGLSEIINILKKYVEFQPCQDKIEGYGKVLCEFKLLAIGGSLWSTINDLKLVRNSITHENSRISKSKFEDLKMKINKDKYSGITLNGETIILANNQILKDSINKYREVFWEIYENSHKITTESRK